MQTHRFTEPRSYDTPLADMPDWEEIERVADQVRRTRIPERKAFKRSR